ncbi:hypothetical protein [Plantibacter sp. YIM 135347]|uniref:hypothetical protein n=1 Tax=Plantibacter sp. YIM 135347 TaxID=3423919 RepID=UPI003D347E34
MAGDIGDASSTLAGRRALRWWVADASWAVGNDVYARSVYVGGTNELIRDLLAHPDLEALRVDSSAAARAEDG